MLNDFYTFDFNPQFNQDYFLSPKTHYTAGNGRDSWKIKVSEPSLPSIETIVIQLTSSKTQKEAPRDYASAGPLTDFRYSIFFNMGDRSEVHRDNFADYLRYHQ